MAITRAKKEEIVKNLREIFSHPGSVVFVNFEKLMVSEMTELRRKLRAEKSRLLVVRKSLLARVLGEQSVTGDRPELPGEVAIAYGEDAVAPAKQVADFKKSFQEKIRILGGILDGKYLSAVEMSTLAAIPPRKTLLGMFANVINSPISGLVIALDAVAKKKEANS